MKIIFLNSWYGRAGGKFLNFVKDSSPETDIYCFQEVQPELFSELKNILSGYQEICATGNKIEVLGFVYGQAVFVKENYEVLSSGKINLYRNVTNDFGFMQFISIKVGEKVVYIANIHGKARPGSKLDTSARLKQSKIIIDFFKDKKAPKIIGGDFNLLPQTKGVKMFEEAGYRNLIKDFKVKSTRNHLAWDNLKEGEEKQSHADYVFVSKDVKVKDFSIPDIVISDHLPLVLDFGI